MDIPAAAATPWLVLGVALGIALVVVIGLTVASVRSRSGRSPAAADPADLPPEPAQPAVGTYAEDDLPRFLDSPPGSASDPPAPRQGWPALSAAPLPPSAAAPAVGPSSSADPGRSTAGVLAAMASAALVLVAAAAAVAAVG